MTTIKGAVIRNFTRRRGPYTIGSLNLLYDGQSWRFGSGY
jgi:hypothetical protein